MKVYLANYPNYNDNNTAYDRQRDLIIDAIQTYGTANIGGIIVGNEFMLKYVLSPAYTLEVPHLGKRSYLTDAGQQDPNSAVGNQGSSVNIFYLVMTS